MSDYTLKILKMKSKKYEDYVNCINPDYNRDEEIANEIITRFNEYEKENQELKTILKKIENIITGSLHNVGFNDDCYEYWLGDGDIEKILEMIPEFEEDDPNE